MDEKPMAPADEKEVQHISDQILDNNHEAYKALAAAPTNSD